MTKIRAVLCDYDGTLVDNDHIYSQKTKILIGELQAKKVRFSIATGRFYFGKIEEVIKDLGINGLHIIHGGGGIIDTEKTQFVFKQVVSRETVRKIADYLHSNKVIFGLETDSFIYVSPFTHTSQYLINAKKEDYANYNGGEDVYKILVFSSGNKFDSPTLERHIKNIQKLATDIEIIRFQFMYDNQPSFGVDITSEYATKHTAVLEYCKILGLDPSEVAAMGDGYNDYPLLTAAGFKIAMGNANPELKKIADLIVAPVDRGGTEEALSYILKNLT
ncbi:MAG: HAD-IIB family hydrolase [Patescibacteria group bacterium]